MDFRALQKEFQKVTEDKLSVGALIITPLSREEGLKLKSGKDSRNKRLVIIGVDRENRLCYGSVLVNTDMSPQSDYSPQHLASQYLLRREPHYETFLVYDSYVDCAEIIPVPYEKLMVGEYHGQLEENDKEQIFDLLEHTKTIPTIDKKRFGIRRM